jgi:hypothetical protein
MDVDAVQIGVAVREVGPAVTSPGLGSGECRPGDRTGKGVGVVQQALQAVTVPSGTGQLPDGLAGGGDRWIESPLGIGPECRLGALAGRPPQTLSVQAGSCRSLPEDEALREGVGGEPIRTVEARTRALADCEEAGKSALTIEVDGESGVAGPVDRSRCTTMRSRVEPGGWQANNVAVGS